MDDFQKISTRARLYLLIILVVENTLLAAGWLGVRGYVPAKWQLPALLGGEVILIILSVLVAVYVSRWLLAPLEFIWRAVTSLAPASHEAAPDPDRLKLGRDLVANLTRQIYQLASASAAASEKKPASGRLDFVAHNLPLPLIVIDEADNLKFANVAALKYLDKTAADMAGKQLYDVLDMSFWGTDTFSEWLKTARSSNATAEKRWGRVKLNLPDVEPERQFDLVAYYNRGNAAHFETILVLFDQTERYAADDDQASFVALAVHELRNPLTMLRGYIEILEEEVDDKTNLELTTDLQKMRASAKLLTEYTNNILNVSRVDSDQLSLHLKSENWAELIKSVAESMRLRAQVHGLKIEVDVASTLPPAGIDRVSMSEVLTNLIDNAIKYSQGARPITVSASLNQAGEIETTVKNYGVVIGDDVIGNLFTRFYRNHRSRSQATGTGLGLYLSKSLVEAQGGSIWVKSSELGGTTFGFTVLPFDKVEGRASGDSEITRVPHGWIKNHSLYRR